jgi:hypothetical protein
MRFGIAAIGHYDIAFAFVVSERGESLAAADQVDGRNALDENSAFLIVELDPLPACAGVYQFLRVCVHASLPENKKMRTNPMDRIARVGVRFDFSLLYRLAASAAPVGSVNFNVSLNAIARRV